MESIRMADKGQVYEEIYDMIHRGVEDGFDSADHAVLQSKLAEATEGDVYALLAEFFDVELVVEALFQQYTARGSEWSIDLRQKLAEALIFCGLDRSALQVLASVS
jgi:hypothetical protein